RTRGASARTMRRSTPLLPTRSCSRPAASPASPSARRRSRPRRRAERTFAPTPRPLPRPGEEVNAEHFQSAVLRPGEGVKATLLPLLTATGDTDRGIPAAAGVKATLLLLLTA